MRSVAAFLHLFYLVTRSELSKAPVALVPVAQLICLGRTTKLCFAWTVYEYAVSDYHHNHILAVELWVRRRCRVPPHPPAWLAERGSSDEAGI